MVTGWGSPPSRTMSTVNLTVSPCLVGGTAAAATFRGSNSFRLTVERTLAHDRSTDRTTKTSSSPYPQWQRLDA